MAPTRKVCHRQLELLIEFAEANRRLVLGGLGKGPLGQQAANKAWEEVTRRLNSIGGGVIKNPENWKRYWHLLKCRTKCKAADLRRSRVGTGGGPNKSIPLSDLEERIVAIIGKEAVEGNPEVRIPLDLTAEIQPTASCSSNLYTSPASSSIPSTAPASSLETGLEFVDVNTESAEVLECQEVELENSFFEQPSGPHASPSSPAAAEPPPSAAPALSEQASVRRAAPVLTAPSLAGASGTHNTTQRRPRRNRDENLPAWAYDVEERRIAVEERLVAEIAGLGQTNRAILACLEQLVQLLVRQWSNQAP